MIQVYSGITSDRVLDGELLCTKILEVNLFAFAYRVFHGLLESLCIFFQQHNTKDRMRRY